MDKGEQENEVDNEKDDFSSSWLGFLKPSFASRNQMNDDFENPSFNNLQFEKTGTNLANLQTSQMLTRSTAQKASI